ncbi:hypothetical protein [Streptomyces sp. NPDC005336]|uniref:hypothetical protein n=1 Tax=Streptomyces sp. NPDC005336 TaxID=3157035 RepID=UPI0033B6FAAB
MGTGLNATHQAPKGCGRDPPAPIRDNPDISVPPSAPSSTTSSKTDAPEPAPARPAPARPQLTDTQAADYEIADWLGGRQPTS